MEKENIVELKNISVALTASRFWTGLTLNKDKEFITCSVLGLR